VGSGGIEQGRKKQEEEAAAAFKWLQENPPATAAQYVEQLRKIAENRCIQSGIMRSDLRLW
jgi:hypothetical protein